MTDIQASISALADASVKIAEEAVLVVRLDEIVKEHDASVELAHRHYLASCREAETRAMAKVAALVRELRTNREVDELTEGESGYDED